VALSLRRRGLNPRRQPGTPDPAASCSPPDAP
jgi:hypothetical protein